MICLDKLKGDCVDFSKIIEKYNNKLNHYKEYHLNDFENVLAFKNLESEIIRCKDYCTDQKEKLKKIKNLKNNIILLANKYNPKIKLYSQAKKIMLKKGCRIYKLQDKLKFEIKRYAKENNCQIYHISKVSPKNLINNKLLPHLAANMFHTKYQKFIFGTIEEKKWLFYSLSGGGNQGYIDINSIRDKVFLPENIFDTYSKNKLLTTKDIYKYEIDIDFFEPQVDFRLSYYDKNISKFVYFGEWTSSKPLDQSHFRCDKVYDISKALEYYDIYIHNDKFDLKQLFEEYHHDEDFDKVINTIEDGIKKGCLYSLNTKFKK